MALQNIVVVATTIVVLLSLIDSVVGQTCGANDACSGHGECQGRTGCICELGWRGDVCNSLIGSTTLAPGATPGFFNLLFVIRLKNCPLCGFDF
jgi:hypothetical protein